MKKFLCLLLAMMLILSLAAGCSSSNNGSNTTDTPAQDTPSNSTGSDNTNTGDDNNGYVYEPIDWGNNPASDVGQDVLRFDMVAKTKDLPLTNEKATLSAWWPMRTNDYYTNYNEAANIIEMENRTNIHIEYFHPSTTEVATAFPLMVASDDYCDMIYYSDYYTGGGDKAIADGVYIRLNELIDEYAPNYNAIRNYTDDARKMTITSEGNIWAFYAICFEHMPGYMGLNIRQDFMDRAGVTERPVTVADWDETLGIMFNAIDEAEYAIAIPPTGITRWSAFLSAWDIGGEWFQRDGVTMYGPCEPEFRNYVELMVDWYNKGYIRSDFYAVSPDNYNMDITWKEYANGKCVAADGSNTFGNMLASWGQAEAYGLAVRQPVLNEGDETHIRFDQGVINGQQLSISTQCENPELAVAWLDYRYTFDGYLLIYYGIEGLTYQMTGDYHIQITDNIINNEDGTSPFTYLGKYTAGILSVSLSDYTNGWCFLDPAYAVEILVWGQDKCDHNYPDIGFLSADDGAEFSSIYADIETYIHETVPKFISGAISMDKYDDFVAKINSMGIDRCIAIKQAALDDYNAR